jgi:hypothetical protein
MSSIMICLSVRLIVAMISYLASLVSDELNLMTLILRSP